MHNVRLLQRRFPKRSTEIIVLLVAVSALLLGIGLLILL